MKRQFFLLNALALITAGFCLSGKPARILLSPLTGKVEKLPSADSYMQKLQVINLQIQASSSLRLTLKKPLITIINRCSLWRVQDFNLRKQTSSKL